MKISQKEVEGNRRVVYTLDTENTAYKSIWVKNKFVQLFFEDDEIRFINFHNNYRIVGKTNITEKELIQVLEQIEY